jgi:hypothetical protein
MKRLIAAALVFLLLFSITTAYGASPGSSGDPLISLNYLNGTFMPSAESEAKALVSSTLGSYYGDYGDKLKAAYESYLARLGGLDGYKFAGSFTPVSLPAGATAGLITGSTLIVTSGAVSMTVESGAVVNISTGQEAGSAALTANQRYFCAEDAKATFKADSDAVCLIDGYYTTTGSVVTNPTLFTDVRSSDWFYNAVSYVSGKNLFSGTTPTTFSPQSSMTRGMFVTVLYRLAGKPAVSAASSFPDVKNTSAYYYSPVVWANANAIVTGSSDGKFHPDDAITREQMALIIWRYASFAGYNASASNTSVYDSFPDKGSVSAYAQDAMKWATGAGIIGGSDGKLLPKATASRAQVAQIMLNFCQKIIGL